MLFVILSNASVAADWQALPFARKGAVAHVDRASMRQTSDHLSVWVRSQFEVPILARDARFAFTESRQRLELRCQSRSVNWQEAAFFGTDGEWVGEDRPKFSDWREVIPDSFDEALLKHLCGAPTVVTPCALALTDGLLRKSQASVRYPTISLRFGERGYVIVSVTIHSDRPGLATVTRSSGYSRLDQASLAAVTKHLAELRVPTDCADGTVSFDVPMTFSME